MCIRDSFSTAADALATCAATHSLQVSEFRLSCTVWFGTGLPCRRLSAGWRLWTEISAIRWMTCLLRATSEQRSILRGGWAACMEWAAVQSTRHCSIVSCLQRTFEDTFIFVSRVGPRRICDIYDFFAARINALTYLLTSCGLYHFCYQPWQSWGFMLKAIFSIYIYFKFAHL